jgi:hypothetical protein
MEQDPPSELADRRDALYARVTKRGRFLRYRRVAVAGAAIAAVLAVPVVAVAATSGRDHGTTRVAAVAPTSTTSSSASTPWESEVICPATPRLEISPPVTASVPIVLANVIGQKLSAGDAIMQQLGLCVRVKLAASATVASGAIVATSPGPGARVAFGTIVTLTVSTGPPTSRSTTSP